MKLSPRFTVWLQAFVFIGCMTALKAEVTPGTYVASQVTGKVTWTNPTSKVTAPLKDGQKLPQGATITTGDDSSVILSFANGATETLSANTSLEVTRFYQQNFTEKALLNDELEPSVSVTELNLIQGQIAGHVRRLRSGSTFDINTPVGAAGVRGTDYLVTFTNGHMSVTTASGLVVATWDGQNINITPGLTFTSDTGKTVPARREVLSVISTAVRKAGILNIVQVLNGGGGLNPDNPTPPSTITVPVTDDVSPSQQ